MYKVAICIPCYNNKKTLKRLLDSIVIQDFKDYIVIITDDSDDDLIKNLVFKYSNLKILYYKNNKKLGVAKNTNKALQYAQDMGVEYIKIMYHDDYFSSSTSLYNMVKALENNPDAILAFSNAYHHGKNINYERIISKEQIEILKDDYFNLVYSNIIGAPSVTIIRKNDIYLDEHLKWFVDIEWYIQMFIRNEEFVYIDESLITIGLSESQVTRECVNNPEVILNECIYIYRKYLKLHCENYVNFIFGLAEKVISRYNIFQISKKLQNIFIYGAGEKGKDCAEFLEQSNVLFNSFIVSDGKREFRTLLGHEVIELTEYLKCEEKNVIILALNDKNLAEVEDGLKMVKAETFVWK